LDPGKVKMNDTGKGGYLWHLNRAAILDQQAARHRKRGMFHDAYRCEVQAEKHRRDAALLELEQKATA
jgi:hypothetical protein